MTSTRPIAALPFGAALGLLFLASPSSAQDQARVDFKRLTSYGMGFDDAGSQTLRSLRLPLSGWLIPLEGRNWGLKLRVPMTFGVTNFDLGENAPLDSLKALTVLPTAEVHYPLNEVWMLRPFVGIGGGWEFETGRSAWLGTTGVIAEATRPYRPWTVNYGSALRYDWNMNSDGSAFDSFGRLELKLELRRALGASVSGHHLEPGVYGMGFFYWDPLVIPGGTSERLEVVDEYEVGVSLGSLPDVKLLGIGLPRVFLGWRFGNDIQGVRLTFGSLF